MEAVLIKEKPPKKPPSVVPAVIMSILIFFGLAGDGKIAKNMASAAAKVAIPRTINIDNSFHRSASNVNSNNATSFGTASAVRSRESNAASRLSVYGGYQLREATQQVDLNLTVQNGARQTSFSTVVVRARYFNGNGRQIWHKDVHLRGRFKARKSRKVQQTIPSITGASSVKFEVMEAW